MNFEAFEASPRAKDVLATENALQWDFPGLGVTMSENDFNNESFLKELSSFLSQASTETIKMFVPHSHKAGESTVETRDTTNPGLITDLLMTMLQAMGQLSQVSPTSKRIRDAVVWQDGSELPWRRSPSWLVLRVGLIRILIGLYGTEVGSLYYKMCICVVMEQLLQHSMFKLPLEALQDIRTKLYRRLDKLENENMKLSRASREEIDHVVEDFQTLFYTTLDQVDKVIIDKWNTFKSHSLRKIIPLPMRASEKDTRLTLPNSGAHINQLLQIAANQSNRRDDKRYSSWHEHPSTTLAKRFYDFAKRYYRLAEVEQQALSGIPQSTLR